LQYIAAWNRPSMALRRNTIRRSLFGMLVDTKARKKLASVSFLLSR
jgi:hypothetical protein